MRLFLGVGLDSGLAGYLGRWSRRWPGSRGAGIRLIAPRDYHMTLLFLGGHQQSVVAQIHTRLLRIGSLHAPFACQLDSIGLLPCRGQPRVLVADVEKRPELIALYRELYRAMDELLPERSEHQYRPHITLARASRRRAVVPSLKLEGYPMAGAGNLSVDAVTLYESLPHPARARYRPLLKVALTGC